MSRSGCSTFTICSNGTSWWVYAPSATSLTLSSSSRKLGLPDRSVRKTSVFTKKPISPSIEGSVRFDPAYRGGPMHPMPDWFRRPLAADPKAKRAWDALIPSRQKEILRYLSWLKSDDARKRNVARALRVLKGETARYMARTWSAGR